MIKKIFISTIKNLKLVLKIWILVLLANQIFLFHACFKPYCIAAALPHTFIIAIVLHYWIWKDEK